MHRWLPLALLASAAAGCQREPRRLDSVPPELQGRVDAARAATGELKKALSGRLQQAMQAGGPAAGIDVCADEAAKLTAGVASARGVTLGRTSHRLRNPAASAPRPWLRAYLDEVSSRPAAEARPAVFDLGSSLGIAEVLPTQALCLACHGDPAKLSPEVSARLRARYPDDRAVGFAEGDVRGVVWVEIPK
ncbi:MAG: DUF3365 domain-containing protein [Polyangiaceae bacterium]|nr:DUF3365 domain-containing protein [Polyangiaceae bacterium]